MTSPADLRQRHAELAAGPRPPRAREAAKLLATTEAALLASGALGDVTPLRPEWGALVGGFRALGRVMALTRNEHAVHERYGRFEDVSTGPGHILVLGPDIDLRMFPGRWAHAFALAGQRRSIQIFGADGEAVFKLYAGEETDRPAWARLVQEFAAMPDSAPPLAPVPAEPPAADGLVDAKALREDWLALKDTHDFFPLLRRHKASRRQAFRLAGEDLAMPLEPGAASALLEAASVSGTPIMCFVGNRGNIQIHTGPVAKLLRTGPWFNVLDPDFNLHLNEAGIAEAWRVVKPTEDGAVTSIELLDETGEVIALFFGARKPGQPELQAWREIVGDVAHRHALSPVVA
ncbi:hemin-degrading factor [Rhodovarius crocodyli]|uniref:Hemin-degrading factor n=1 Tax=Rhodovarius crocodyli TaxID=1979269 RepID=A0A437M4D2_9PROT|nr:ChuX/HutX family heme-like substrate-binding protein [Rhodovarius crocodyli]RVT92334.1 hemin-degrading factor [Rhodovarius crocodyli]